MMSTEQKTTQITQPGTAKSVPVEIAQEYLAAGLSVLPASRQKKHPVLKAWTEYQTRLPEEQEVKKWFSTRRDALCVVCGKVSGNLEVIDFDNHGELYDAWKTSVPEELLSRLVIERSQSGGYHVIYQCEKDVAKGDKLASGERNGRTTTLIETRGKGNVILCAPSDGYVLVQGDWRKLPVITGDERGVLISAAKAMDESKEDSKDAEETPKVTSAQAPPIPSGMGGWEIRPIDDFNQRGDIRPYLEKAGWALLRTDGKGEEYWRRPKQTEKDRHGATFFNGAFHIFSTDAAPFEAGKNYNKFDVYAILEHSGDKTAAVSALVKDGFGRPCEQDTSNIDWNGLLAKGCSVTPPADEREMTGQCPQQNADSAPEVSEEELRETLIETLPFPERLYDYPGLVGEIMQTTLEYASTPNRPLALSGALAMMSYLTARKVKSPSGLRSNVYLLALAVSGSGKERPRDINQMLCEETRTEDGLLEDVTSGAGLEDMLAVRPALFWQCDEFFATLDEMLREGKDGNNTVMEKLLKMYTSSHKTYRTRAKAGRPPLPIPFPHVVLYATTTPGGFFGHVNDRFLADGMYARLSIMVAEKPSAGRLPVEPSVPREVVEKALAWAQFRPPGSGNNDIAPLAVPYTADAEPMAEELFRRQQERLAEMHRKNAPEWKCSVWNRHCEIALRYALIYACSIAPSPELTVITPDAIRWGSDFVTWEMENKFYMTDRNYFKTDFSRLTDIAMQGLRKWHKENGLGTPMPGWQFNRLFEDYPPNVVKAVVESLQEQQKMFSQHCGRGYKHSLRRFKE